MDPFIEQERITRKLHFILCSYHSELW